MARVKVNKKTYFLGRFSDEEEAATAYDLAALKAFGEFARLNFPERVEQYYDQLTREAT